MRAVRVRGRHFNGRQPSGLNKIFRLRDKSSLGGLMRGIKIPQQDFALKMQGGGGLMREGGAYLRDTTCMVFMILASQHCLIPRPLPDFISQLWNKIGRRPGTITTMLRAGNGGLC